MATLGQDVEYVDRATLCPIQYKGLQIIEGKHKDDKKDNGYCAAWSMFFTELCLRNPSISGFELLTRIRNILEKMTEEQQSKYLKELMRGYANYIKEKLHQYYPDFPNQIKPGYEDHYYFMLQYIIELELKHSNNANAFEIEKEHIQQMIRKGKTKKEREIWENKWIILETHESRFEHLSLSKESIKRKHHSKTQKAQKPAKATKTQKICPSGKVVNPLTGRCIKKRD